MSKHIENKTCQNMEEAVWEIFDKNFSGKKNKKIAIYGIGENTKTILAKAKSYQIVGLFDGIKKGGCIYGFPILDLEDISKKDIDMIVIVARSSNVGVILNRIARFCIDKQIEVYNIQGTDLLNANIDSEFSSTYFLNKEILLDKIEKADVISFDIFDTLIMRKVWFPADIFEFMVKRYDTIPEDFPQKRVACERILLKNNPDIFEIYSELQKIYLWNEKEKDRILELEWKTDRESMILRDAVYDIYRLCCEMGKKVYFISDMYYSKEMIKNILYSFEITDFEDIFVSCQMKTSKSEELFDRYLESVRGKNWLHIGDDDAADIFPAQQRGIDTYHLFSGRQMLEESRYKKVGIYATSSLEKLVIGHFISRMFCNPFAYDNGRGIISNSKDYGYIFIGPLVLKFCLWMIENAADRQIEKILFSARDGFIFKIAYDYLCQHMRGGEELPQSVYFYASRMAFVNISLFDEKDIRFAYELAYDGTPQDMLSERFRLDKEMIIPYDSNIYDTEWSYIKAHMPQILKKAEQCRKNFKKYLKKNHIILSDKMGYFDFVSSGTCQKCLQRTINKKVKGLYFSYIYNKNTYLALDIDELFHNEFGCVSNQFICNHYLFLENIFSSYEPTLKEFDADGNPVFLEEERTLEHIQELKEIHSGIMEFLQDIVSFLNGNLNDDFDETIADMMFSYILKRNTTYLIDMKINGKLIDAFCKRILDANDILGEV